jgi:outer membrane protein assembly factor BamA
MIRRGLPRAIAGAASCALLLALPCAAQTLPKSSSACAPTCPPTDQTAEASEAKPHPKIIIDNVIFEGPTPPPDSQTAQRVIEEIKHHPCVKTHWRDEILDVSVLSPWQEDGYFKAVSNGKSEIISDDGETQHVVLTIHVDAGMQYSLGKVAFRTNEAFRTGDPDEPVVFSAAELRPLLDLQEGEVSTS